MLLMIDNYDSFTYNLVQLFGALGQEVQVFRNDALTLEEAEGLNPDYLVVSPGPGAPDEAGISVDMIRLFAGRIPVLGVCLGHQGIGEALLVPLFKAVDIRAFVQEFKLAALGELVQGLQDVQTADDRHHDIEKHQIRFFLSSQHQSLLAILCSQKFHAFIFQIFQCPFKDPYHGYRLSYHSKRRQLCRPRSGRYLHS